MKPASADADQDETKKFVNIGKHFFLAGRYFRDLFDFDVPDFDVAVLSGRRDALVVQPGQRVDLEWSLKMAKHQLSDFIPSVELKLVGIAPPSRCHKTF